jgi:hypothetical protein
MPKVKENNIGRKDGQIPCVGHKMIVTLRFYRAETRFPNSQHNANKIPPYLSVCPSVHQSVCLLAMFGTASLTICGLCNIEQHNNNKTITDTSHEGLHVLLQTSRGPFVEYL